MAKRTGASEPGLTRRQTSRAKREAMIQRWVVIGTIVTAVAVVGLVAFAVINQQVLRPGRAIATVNGETITVKQFQDRVRVDLYFLTLNPFGGNTDPRVIAQQTLDDLVNEALVRQKAKELNVEVTDAEVKRRAELLFGYDGGTPEPTSTSLPTSESTKPTTPTATSTFVFTPTATQTQTPDPAVTSTPSPTFTASPTVTPTIDLTTTATPTLTPTNTLVPTATLTGTPRPTSTPISVEAFSTQFADFLTNGSKLVGLTNDQVNSIWLDKVRGALYREKVLAALSIQPDQTREKVHAAHILVATEQEANQILDRINGGESFETLAAQFSTDPSNAYKGGDLGWFTKEDMVEAFSTAAFSTPVGTISKPIQSSFGWHIIKVYDKAVVPLSPSEQETSIQTKFTDTVAQWRKDGQVTTDPDWAQYMPQLPGQ